MSLTSDTVQFIAKVFALTIALGVLSIVGIDGVSILHFGDGEALQLIGQLNGPLISAFGALSAATVGHQILGTVLSRLFGSSVPVAAPGSSVTIPMNVPVNVPVQVPQLQTTPASNGNGNGNGGSGV